MAAMGASLGAAVADELAAAGVAAAELGAADDGPAVVVAGTDGDPPDGPLAPQPARRTERSAARTDGRERGVIVRSRS